MARPAELEETAPATGLTGTPGDYGFPPGTRAAGRYVLGERLGAGGMGIVYSARDERLDRQVALKLLRPDAGGSGDAHQQLVREAQTLARLAHPNVVTVHDIGDFEGRVYVEMELVKGSTLTQWLRASRRSARNWQEVLEVFIQAGRGLAAAHAVGIVHRDFKPDNVLVGDDGRVRVADFGIALLGPRAARIDSGDVANPADSAGAKEKLSPAGWSQSSSVARTGTPAYMAPEQRRDGAADARSDQYSYCVALHEAMHGARPRANSEGTAGLMPPAWLEQAIDRGLSSAPEQRYPDMNALLDVLVSEPRRRRRRRRTMATGAAAAAFLTAGVVWGSARSARSSQLCRGSDAKLAGIWDDARRGEIERNFLATAKPFAADAWRGAKGALDSYTREWVATRTEACEATRLRGEQSDQVLGLRMSCLDERLEAVSALSLAFTRADGKVVAHAFSATQALPTVASCSDTKRLLARSKAPSDPRMAAKVADLGARMAEVRALNNIARYRDALALVRPIAAEAAETDDVTTQAAALYWLGILLGRTSDLPGAEVTLRRAASAADAAGDDALRVKSLGGLLFFAAGIALKVDLIPTVREEASGALARLGGDGDVEGQFLLDLSAALQAAGKHADARDVEERAAMLEARAHGKDSWQEAIALTDLGNGLTSLGLFDEAIEVEMRSLAIGESQLGPVHPFVAAAEGTIADAMLEDGKPVLAEPHIRRAVALAEGTVSDEELSQYIGGLGEVLAEEGKLDEALACYQRALAMLSKAHAPDDPILLVFLAMTGDAYVTLGKPALGVPYLERALALPSEGEEAYAATAQFALARALYGAPSTRARARTLALQAKEGLEKVGAEPGAAKHLAEVEGWLARVDSGKPG